MVIARGDGHQSKSDLCVYSSKVINDVRDYQITRAK